MFTGPATGLWICGPLMSLIDTAVIGQGSSIELAALGIPLFYAIKFVFFFLFVFLFLLAEEVKQDLRKRLV